MKLTETESTSDPVSQSRPDMEKKQTPIFGFHYDLHAVAGDTKLGLQCDPSTLAAILRRISPDFVQTDAKGHPGYTSWFSRTAGASVPKGLRKDALAGWRKATAQLDLPLHAHYSGIWDAAAAANHPEWVAVRAAAEDGAGATGQNVGGPRSQWMCPRSGYLHEFMIPQMLELIDSYGIDGFWIDGDLWAVEPCYCDRCTGAFRQQTGRKKPPLNPKEADWPEWWNFTRQSYHAFVTSYCDAVHRHKPGVRVCSNWMQTLCDPGEPDVPTDWISGDNMCVFGLDGSRCEARFLSTRGKPWDIMLWTFHVTDWMKPNGQPCFKSFDMLAQEAAVAVAFGGAIQLYDSPRGIRDGKIPGWHVERLAKVGRFIRQRAKVCRDTESVPQIAVLHSEHHVRATVSGQNLMWAPDTAPVRGAVYALLECGLGVDVLDEWALGKRMTEFPMIVVPEQVALSEEMREALTRYAEAGGHLLVSGDACGLRWGAQFFGCRRKTGTPDSEGLLHVGTSHEAVPVKSRSWGFLRPLSAKASGKILRSDDIENDDVGAPAAVVNRLGKGSATWIPFDIFRAFQENRYPPVRRLIAEVIGAIPVRWELRADVPPGVDVIYRRKGSSLFVHFINRLSGLPNQPGNGAVDNIPSVGPLKVGWRLSNQPVAVRLHFEKSDLSHRFHKNRLSIELESVRIHAVVEIQIPRGHSRAYEQ